MFEYFVDLIIKYFSFILCFKFIFCKLYRFDYNKNYKKYFAIIKNETCEQQNFIYNKFTSIPCKTVYVYKVSKINGWLFPVITYMESCFYTEDLEIITNESLAHRAICRRKGD